ncbi:G2/mitotic-specific cyclin-A-like isoform X4 [Bolinopsis microptera]|uniref:G2/mitotic-specific cyclin-A-like isoform X4 n=1 Tax=Bolinopsis microptera TaxID=2820187 RepID=UPI00307AFDC8
MSNARSSTFNNMPLVYTQNNDENYPPITSMLRKTKRDEPRLAGTASKRPALASINNIQSIGTANSDLGKQIKQRQTNPFSVRVDTKKPSPKQKQIASRAQRTSCTNNSRLSSVANVMRQSTLSSFSTNTTTSSTFSVFKDRSSVSSSAPALSALRDRTNIPTTTTPASSKPSECPMSVEASRTPRSTRSRHASCASLRNMDIDESSNFSDMSIDLKEEAPLIKNIDEGASLEESPEYVEDIDNHLRKMEELYKPKPGYMSRQRYITIANRSTVIDWMFEVLNKFHMKVRKFDRSSTRSVCDEFHLSQKTFQLAVSYVDRFLSKMNMPRKNLQLLGTTALFIACKVEEIYVPVGSALAARFVWITDNTYTVHQLFKMEVMILNKLDYEINSPTTLDFQDRFIKASGGDCTEQYLTEYLCNRSLIHGDKFLKYTPSLLTAAAIGLSRATQKPTEPVWTPTLAHYTKYTYPEIKECMSDLLQLQKLDVTPDSRRYAAVWNKYNLARYMFVLQKQPIESIPTHQ